MRKVPFVQGVDAVCLLCCIRFGLSQVQNDALKAACPVPFDEGRLWKSDDSALLRAQLQQHFQNMTKAMDCVGCEKCKLWGKLQLLGACLFPPVCNRTGKGRVSYKQCTALHSVPCHI